MLKRSLALFLALFAVISLFSFSAGAIEEPITDGVRNALLYNVENDIILYEKAAEDIIFPASSVKLMTALVASEKLSMTREIAVTSAMLRGVSGNSFGFEDGERVTCQSLFYALLISGSNDAALILANAASGSVDSFVAEMNTKAKALGMKDTVYLNPTGMHETGMVTTAKDTLLLCREFAKNDQLLTISSTSKYLFPETNKTSALTRYNRNHLVSKYTETKYYYERAKGMNYGSTNEGGSTVTALVKNDGLTYIAVVLGGTEDEINNVDYSLVVAKTLLEYGIGGFAYINVIDEKMLVCELPVSLSAETEHVMLLPAKGLLTYLPSDIAEGDITYSYRLTYSKLEAPIEEGMPCGYLNVYYKGDPIGTVELVTQNAVERNSFLYTMQRITEFTSGRFFRATVISALVFTVIYVFFNAIMRKKRARKSRYYRF